MITLQHLISDSSVLDRLREQSRVANQEAVYLREKEEDEYYERIGQLVEQHPIVSAGIRRG